LITGTERSRTDAAPAPVACAAGLVRPFGVIAMIDIDAVAAAIHDAWRALSREQGWTMQSRLDRPYTALGDADREDARAAARRMTTVLAAAGLGLSADPAAESVPIAPHAIEAMAEAEHDGWLAHRVAAGWRFAPVRDDTAKTHPSMVPYSRLPEPEKEKDRDSVRHYPDFAARAGCRIVRLA
jgi:RyR domain